MYFVYFANNRFLIDRQFIGNWHCGHRLILCWWDWHSIWVQVHVLAALLLIQTPGKVAGDGLSSWTPASHVGDLDEAPGFGMI